MHLEPYVYYTQDQEHPITDARISRDGSVIGYFSNGEWREYNGDVYFKGVKHAIDSIKVADEQGIRQTIESLYGYGELDYNEDIEVLRSEAIAQLLREFSAECVFDETDNQRHEFEVKAQKAVLKALNKYDRLS